MLCEDIMKIDVESVSPVDSIQEAARRMRDGNVGFLPVCDESRQVLGTITDRDIAIRAVAEAQPSSTPVEDVMTGEVVACSPKDSIDGALQLMAENHKSRIMCLDEDGGLVGVISLSDIAQLVGDASETLRQVSDRETNPN
jgi:CBS domain-containing protein